MGVAPHRCLVVEDSVPGVVAAVAAGMPAIGFTGGSHCRPDHEARPCRSRRRAGHRPDGRACAGARATVALTPRGSKSQGRCLSYSSGHRLPPSELGAGRADEAGIPARPAIFRKRTHGRRLGAWAGFPISPITQPFPRRGVRSIERRVLSEACDEFWSLLFQAAAVGRCDRVVGALLCDIARPGQGAIGRLTPTRRASAAAGNPASHGGTARASRCAGGRAASHRKPNSRNSWHRSRSIRTNCSVRS